MGSISSPQSQQAHNRQPSATYEAPLHPEIRSIVSLATAHTQKEYFAGPLVQEARSSEAWHDIWAQLCGTTLSIWDRREKERTSRQGEEVPPSYVNVTEAVRPAFHLDYLRDDLTKPSPTVRPCHRLRNTARDSKIPSSQIH